MCHMITGVGAFESPDQEGPSRYLKHISLTSRNVFTILWCRRIQSKMSEISCHILKLFQNVKWDFAHFWLKSSTSEACENFSRCQSYTLRYLEGPPWWRLSNAPTSVVIWHIDQLRSYENAFLKDFFKNPSRNFEIWDEILSILTELFDFRGS